MTAKKLLVLAPHTDDAEIGCGGTISFLKRRNYEVYIVAFSSAADSLPAKMPRDTLVKEYLASAKKMGIIDPRKFIYDFKVREFSYYRQEILDILISLRKLINPDLVLLPSTSDFHQDHQTISQEGIRAFKNSTILGYELPWNHNEFSGNYFFHLSEQDLQNKWEYMSSYESQVKLNRGYFVKDKIFSWAKMRGMQCNSQYAECFEHIRTNTYEE